LFLLLLSYTGVLLATTAIPVWCANRALLPVQFVASALGSGAACLELAGHRDAPLNLLGAYLLRAGWLAAGRASALDPAATLYTRSTT
jgi:formate-dependent nitrite reductase membrane component NrfD